MTRIHSFTCYSILFLSFHFIASSSSSFISGNSWSNKDYVLYEVSQNGLNLEQASFELRQDKDVVAAAVTQNPFALEFAAATLKDDPKFATELLKNPFLTKVKKDGMQLKDAPNALKNDKDVVLAAVMQNGMSLQYADSTLRRNEKIVTAAIQNNGCSLEFAAHEFKSQTSIVEKAIQFDSDALKYADDSVKINRDFLMRVMSKSKKILQYAKEEIKNDKTFVLQVLALHGEAFEYVSGVMQDDEEVLMRALKKDHTAVQYASQRLQNLPRVKEAVRDRWLKHISLYPGSLRGAPDDIKDDAEIKEAALKKNPDVLKALSVISIGDRIIITHKGWRKCCGVDVPKLKQCSKYKGTVKYVGTVDYASGHDWYGIEMDEPGIGKNNGTVRGRNYFSTSEKMGLLVRRHGIMIDELEPDVASL